MSLVAAIGEVPFWQLQVPRATVLLERQTITQNKADNSGFPCFFVSLDFRPWRL